MTTEIKTVDCPTCGVVLVKRLPTKHPPDGVQYVTIFGYPEGVNYETATNDRLGKGVLELLSVQHGDHVGIDIPYRGALVVSVDYPS